MKKILCSLKESSFSLLGLLEKYSRPECLSCMWNPVTACRTKYLSPECEMLQSPSGKLPWFCYQVSGTCKQFISLITTLICKSDRVGKKNQEHVASTDFPECLLVLQIDISIKIQDPVVLSGCKFLPGLANYCDLLDILGNSFRNSKK